MSETNGIVHRIVGRERGVGSNVDGWVHGGGNDKGVGRSTVFGSES
jgi:hypothetical protein